MLYSKTVAKYYTGKHIYFVHKNRWNLFLFCKNDWNDKNQKWSLDKSGKNVAQNVAKFVNNFMAAGWKVEIPETSVVRGI